MEKKKTSKKKKAVIIICTILVVILAAAGGFWLYLTSGLNQVKLNASDLGIVNFDDLLTVNSWQEQEAGDGQTYGIDKDKWERIRNIAVFGIDSTDEQAWYGDQYRSDSIIIVSVDTDQNTLKLTNILRDSKVPIEGHDPQKINAAYKYGMAPLAIKTLNQNFKLNIEDYVTIDFAAIENVVDTLGGVEVELSEAEAALVDGAVPGWNTLNGYQAMLYARIRKIDSDYYRANRQQTIISCLFAKIQAMPLTKLPQTLKDLLNCVETSLSYTDILSIVLGLDLKSVKVIYNTIPDSQYETELWGGIDSDHGEWVYIYDIDKAALRLHEFIYGE